MGGRPPPCAKEGMNPASGGDGRRWRPRLRAGDTGRAAGLSSVSPPESEGLHFNTTMMKAVILAAGKGTRMRAVSLGLPKMLLPLGDRTIGDNLIRGLKDCGVSEILVIVGHMEEQVRDHFGDGASLGVRIHYLRQEDPLGTGHAASRARDFTRQEPVFVLAYGDIATPPENLPALVADFREHSPEASMSTYRVKDPSKGAAVYVENGYMRSLVEKPAKGTSTTHLDNAGIYVFTPRVFEMLDRIGLSPRNEYELTDALTLLIANGYKIRAFELAGFWSNVSSPEDLLHINKLVINRLAKTRETSALKSVSGAEISSLAVVHPGTVLGRCTIGDYAVIAEGVRVMDRAEVSHAIVCRNASIGEGSYLNHVLVRPEGVVSPGGRHKGTEKRVLILPDEG